MEYKELGNSRIKVSKLGVGTWQFGQTNAWGPANLRECQNIVDYAIEAGVNLFDTAEGYGKSEEILGKLLQGKRAKIILATKIGGSQWDYATMKTHIKRSLKRLRTDYIDLYQIHWPKIKEVPWIGRDMEEKDYEDIFTSMAQLKEEGLIRFAGISNFRLNLLQEFSEEALDFIVANQVPYSLLWRAYEVEGVSDFCKKKKISFLPYSPLAQGLLTGRFGKEGEEITEDTRQSNILFNEPIYTRALKVVDVVKKIAEEVDATPSQVSLKWAMERKVVASVLAGVRKLNHLKDNIEAVNLQLTNEQLDELDRASLEFQATLPEGLQLWISSNRKEVLEKMGLKSN